MTPIRHTGRWWTTAGSLFLIALTLVAYLPALQAGYIWDDDDYVTQNAVLQAPDGLWRIWTEPRSIPQYYPLVHTTFWLEVRLWGLNPLGFHAVNILFHGANAALLWLILRRLAVPGALLAAALFALHPVHVESVAWITERKNVLSGLFYLLATLAWLRFRPIEERRDSGNWRWYGISFLLFLLALFSKTVTATWPAAMLLLLWWKHGRMAVRDILLLVPFLILGAGSGLMTAWWESHFVGAKGVEFALGPADRMLIAGRAIWFYAGKLLWPSPLIFIYPRWTIDPTEWMQWLWPLTFLGLLTMLWIGRRRIGRGPLAAVLFHVGTLFPALGFLNYYPMLFSFVADHFQYLASIGLLALTAAGATSGALNLSKKIQMEPLTNRVAAGALLAGALMAILGNLTWNQSRIYRDQQTLWRDTLEKNPSAWIAWNNLGLLLMQEGHIEESIGYFESALRLNPEGSNAHYNLGIALASLGRKDLAAAHYRAAIRINPADSDSHNNLGSILATEGHPAKAIEHFLAALQINPRHVTAHFNLASALSDLGRFPEAVVHFTEALRLDPNNAEAHYNLALTLGAMGRRQEAQIHFDMANRLRHP